MSSLVVTNALYQGRAVDVYVEDGRIRALVAAGERPDGVTGIAESGERFDAGRKLLFPSFIDAHVHLRDPGYEWKEDVASGLRAAAHGGFGAVMCMANTDPVNDDPSVTRYILEKARNACGLFRKNLGPSPSDREMFR